MAGERVKVRRNELCPCGSGRKYKHCCYAKRFRYVRTSEGEIRREIPLDDETQELIQMQVQDFRETFGREPGPQDRLFWDEPEHLEHRLSQAMREAGLPPCFIYAFEKTGRLVSEENVDLISQEDLDEWLAAVEEYDRVHSTR